MHSAFKGRHMLYLQHIAVQGVLYVGLRHLVVCVAHLVLQAAEIMANFFERCAREPSYWDKISAAGLDRIYSRCVWKGEGSLGGGDLVPGTGRGHQGRLAMMDGTWTEQEQQTALEPELIANQAGRLQHPKTCWPHTHLPAVPGLSQAASKCSQITQQQLQ